MPLTGGSIEPPHFYEALEPVSAYSSDHGAEVSGLPHTRVAWYTAHICTKIRTRIHAKDGAGRRVQSRSAHYNERMLAHDYTACS